MGATRGIKADPNSYSPIIPFVPTVFAGISQEASSVPQTFVASEARATASNPVRALV